MLIARLPKLASSMSRTRVSCWDGMLCWLASVATCSVQAGPVPPADWYLFADGPECMIYVHTKIPFHAYIND